jgi:hypothetical protein
MASEYNAGTMLFNPIYKDANGMCEWCGTNITFNLYNPANKASVDNLDPELTIGNVTKTPTFRYKGGDADGTDWDYWSYGENLDLQSGTAPSYNQGSPLLGTNDDSVKFNSGGFYEANSTTMGNVGTNDYVIEIICKIEETSTTKNIIQKRNGSTGDGWSIRIDGMERLYLSVVSSGSGFTLRSTLIPGAWYHILIFVDPDEPSGYGALLYTNGVFTDMVDPSAVGSPDYAIELAIGALNSGGYACDDSIAYVAMWQSSDWMQGGVTNETESGIIAAERFAKLSGRYPYIYKGDPVPTTATRAFAAYLDKIESNKRVLYYVGSEWLRQCHRQDKNGVDFYGYLPEHQVTNLFPYSKDLTNWNKLTSGDSVDTDAAVCPDKNTLKDGIIANSTSANHGFYRQSTITAAVYTFSCFYEPGDQDWVCLKVNTLTNAYCYFNCATGAIGTCGANATGYIEGPFVDDSYRCCIVFTSTAATHALHVYAASADNTPNFTGDSSTTNGYFWGMQLELGDYMTSPVFTDGALATRLMDQLVFNTGANIGGEDIGEGTIVMDILAADYDKSNTINFFSLCDGGSVNDMLLIRSVTTSEYASTLTYATGGDTGLVVPASDVTDNYIHELRVKWDTDALAMIIDGSTSATDTDCDMPDDLDEMHVGSQYVEAGEKSKSLISNLRICKIPTDECP